MGLFLFIEENEGRRKIIADLERKFFPNDNFVICADRAQAMTALARHHNFDGVIADGKPNAREDGSLDFLALLARQEIDIPFVIHSDQSAAEINTALRQHGLARAPRFDAARKGALKKAVESLKTAHVMRAMKASVTGPFVAPARHGGGHLPHAKRMREPGF